MRNLSNTARSISDGKTSGEVGDFTTPFAGEGYQNIIEQANSVSIKKIFYMYGLRLDENNRKTTCPFKSHKGGRETTASFYFYPDTNTYFCYGCRQGSKPVDFVLNMDRCTKIKAAQKILENFHSDSDDNVILDIEDFSERMEIMMNYSNTVRNFHLNFSDEKSFSFIEENCKVFDKLNNKHDLSNDALRSMISQLIAAINNYNP
jgi:hypothetical protein